jgi:predicted DNA-binding protein (MmcQ/YjbR family)
MNVDAFRKLSLSMPGATETVQWGNDLVFKVGGKMFAVAALDNGAKYCVSFKCSDEGFAELQETEGAVPAPYMARAKWIALERFDTVPDREIQERIREAYRLVFEKLPKKAQADAASSKARTPGRKTKKPGRKPKTPGLKTRPTGRPRAARRT